MCVLLERMAVEKETVLSKNNLWNEDFGKLNIEWEQNKNIADMVKAISDYCEAARKVHPDFQEMAFKACLAELCIQAEKDKGGRP